MPTENLFSTPIFVRDLEGDELEKIQSDIHRILPNIEPKPSPWADRVTTSFDFKGVNDIRNHDLINLAQFIFTSLAQYHDDMACPGSEFNLLESWFNFYDKSNFMFSHSHPGHKVSGVYYYQTTGDDGAICFENPNPLSSTRDWPWTFQRHLQHHAVEPKEGRLIMFPSWLRHRVLPNNQESQRISISFNLG
jgi:uncharacterized protein (TIGR02466 family)